MAEQLQLRILTPRQEVYAGPVDGVTMTAAEGEVGILPGHAPLLAALRPGEASIKLGASTQYFALSDGFVEVADDVVTALVRAAEPAHEIDTERAEERRRERERELDEAELSERRMAVATISLEKQLVRLQVARRSD